jgi:uncharacterized phage-associated protein
MASAEAVARYFLWLAAQEPEEEPVTHMRLQKLLYYAQGWCLASRGEPLFEAVIEAWQHGPVVRDVFPKFADFKGRGIPDSESAVAESLSERDKHLIEWVWGLEGKYSAAELRRRTHQEAPWKQARGKLPEDAPADAPISVAAMRAFFLEEYRAFLIMHGYDADQWLGAIEDVRQGRTIPWDEIVAEFGHGVAP